MIRVLVVDDHPVVRRGITQILEDEAEMECCGTAANGSEAFVCLRKRRSDVVLLDLTLPGESGFEVLKRMKTEYPNLPVLILSVHPEDRYALRLLRAGASGYLTKESVPEVLLGAIRKVVAGGRYISSTLAELLATEWIKGAAPKHNRLSDREFQILTRIAQGEALKEIGSELFLSPKTVSTYRQRILEKMGMKNNAELTRYMIEQDLLKRSPTTGP
ncbi:MAG: response regulator transcription factor [Syntrophales bacterium]|nr:response regulator transcription factor [Syntrophales bacterium]